MSKVFVHLFENLKRGARQRFLYWTKTKKETNYMLANRKKSSLHVLRFLSIIALTFLILIGFSTDYSTAVEDDNKKVTIIHTNDIHAQIDDFGKLAAYKTSEENDSDIFFYVDAGDIFSGNPVVDINTGAPIVDLLNQVGLDLIGIGNHEFDYGVEELNKRIEEADFTFLSANTDVLNSEFEQPEPYEIIEKDDVTFGFIALTQAPPATAPKNIVGIQFNDYSETLSQYEQLRDEVDVLIGVNHIGLSEDRKLAEEFPMFDAIIGGHSHTTMSKAEIVNGTTIVQTGSHLNNIGNITIILDGDNEIQSIDWALQSVEELTEVDEDVQKSIDGYNAEMEELLDEVIGETTGLPQTGKYEGDVPLGNFWTDAMREYVGADVAFTNNGGIRADIKAGDLTVGDLFNIEPFANQVMEIDMTGEAIRNVLEYSFVRDGRNQIDLQTSGLEYTIHLDVFGDFSEVEIIIDGEPIRDDQVYKAAVPDYIGSGGSGYEFVGDVITNTAGLMTEAMMAYAKSFTEKNEVIDVGVENRIQVEREKIDSISIAEAIKSNEGRVLVTGHVVDVIEIEGQDAILLADRVDETDLSKMLAVEMKTETSTFDTMDALEDLQGELISVVGELGSYNGQPGMINVEAMKLLNYLSISEAKELENDEVVTIQGIVLSDSGAWGSEGFYIHDTTGGIYVYQGDEKLEEGDLVRLTGEKGEHNGEVQVSGVSTLEVLGENQELPEIKTLPIDAIDESLVGELVQIEQVTIQKLEKTDGYGTFEFVAQSDNREEPLIFRVDNRTGLNFDDFEFKNGEVVDVVGIVGLFNGTLQVKPRKAEDVSLYKEGEEPEIPEEPEVPETPEEPEKPETPEEPEKPGDPSTPEKGDGTLEQDDTKVVPGAGNNDANVDGEKLPSTATNTWNLLAIGGALLFAGIILLVVLQRRRNVKE